MKERRFVIAIVLAAMLPFAPSAYAQSDAFILLSGNWAGGFCVFTGCVPASLVKIDVDSRSIEMGASVDDAEAPSDLTVSADGRHVVWTGMERVGYRYLTVFDMETRSESRYRSNADVTYAHPSRLRLFSESGGSILAVEPQRQQLFSAGCSWQPSSFEISDSGNRLLVSCAPRVLGESEPMRVIDSDTGTVVGTLPPDGSHAVLSRDGTEAYDLVWRWGPPTRYRRFDVATGRLLMERTVGLASDSPDDIAIDPRSGRLFVTDDQFIQVLDGQTLAPITRVAIGRSPRIAFFRDRPLAVVVTNFDTPDFRFGARISLLDTDTFAFTFHGEIRGHGMPLSVAIAPLPPALTLTAHVSGRQVSLAWERTDHVGLATSHVLEVTTTPGGSPSELSLAGGASHLSINDVPSGTYYVRIRGVNATGSGPRSNEVVILVP